MTEGSTGLRQHLEAVAIEQGFLGKVVDRLGDHHLFDPDGFAAAIGYRYAAKISLPGAGQADPVDGFLWRASYNSSGVSAQSFKRGVSSRPRKRE
jgi:hypothetical protein